jgi:hypothetical protein
MTFNRASFKLLAIARFAVVMGLFLLGGFTGVSAQITERQIPPDKFNRMPLTDFRDRPVIWREARNDLYKPFEYSLEGTIDENGKLTVSGIPKFTGDPKSQEIVKDAVEAFSDSGLLKLLQDLKSKKIKLDLTQDGSQFNLNINSEQESANEARTIFNSLNIMLSIGKVMISKNVEEEKDPVRKEKEQITRDILDSLQLNHNETIVNINYVLLNTVAETTYLNFKKDTVKN